MEENRKVFQVHYSDEQKYEIVLGNFLKMLSNRVYIRHGEKKRLLDLEGALERVQDHGNHIYSIRAKNKKTYSLKIILQKITSAGKNTEISEYLSTFESTVRMVVAKDYNKKIAEHVSKNRGVIFKLASLMCDITEYCDQPRFEILTPSEAAQYYKEYNTTPYTTPKMSHRDPIAKYYGVRKGTVFRIIRPSPASGEAIGYRVVD